MPQYQDGKIIYLLRHADASNQSPDGQDFSRPLSAIGEQQAEALSMLFKLKKIKPDYVLASPAQRTKQTGEGALSQLKSPPHITYEEEIYYKGSVGSLYESLKSVPEEAGSVLLVGHNPTIHGIANFLVGDGDAAKIEALAMDFQKGALVAMHCPISEWALLAPKANTLMNYLRPQDYMANTHQPSSAAKYPA